MDVVVRPDLTHILCFQWVIQRNPADSAHDAWLYPPAKKSHDTERPALSGTSPCMLPQQEQHHPDSTFGGTAEKVRGPRQGDKS